MLKKLLVSTVLGVLLFTSLALWAKNKVDPVQVAKLEVVNQLSLSAYQMGQITYLTQVDASKTKMAVHREDGLPISVISFFWIMLTALLFFVARLAARRIK